MFISRKKLEKIIEEEKYKERERIWQEQDRQRENERINRRLDEIQTQVWQLSEKIENKSRKRKISSK